MSNLDNELTDEGNGAKSLQISAVAALRPKRRWKTNPGSFGPALVGTAPGPIVGSRSRTPRLKKSGRPVQIWSSMPMNAHPTAAVKLPARLRIQEAITQSIRDSLSFAHFSHSH